MKFLILSGTILARVLTLIILKVMSMVFIDNVRSLLYIIASGVLIIQEMFHALDIFFKSL